MQKSTNRRKESLVATAVARKLKKYLDIQRREQAFDLSSLNHPTSETPSKYDVIQRSKLNSHDLDRLTKVAFIEHEMKKVNSSKHLAQRELQAKANLELNMAQYKTPGIVSPYKVPFVGKKSNLSGEEVLKRRRKRRVTSARLGRGSRLIRSAPPQRISNAERERIVNLTSKLLVATETIALPQERYRNDRSSQSTSEESYPILPAVRRLQGGTRPKSAYSDPGPKSKALQELNPNRVHSADHNKLEQTSSDGSLKDADFLVKLSRGNYLISKPSDNYPSSILSGNSSSSTRPKSGKHRISTIVHTGFSSEEEDGFYNHSSLEVTPLPTPIRAWSEDKFEGDVPGGERSFIHNNSTQQLPIPQPVVECKQSVNMSTQTKPQPKVLTYAVYVVTGNKVSAETTSSVKITLFGEYGDSGERPLFKSRVNRVPFKRNQVDIFNLDCMSLGKLTNIRIGHNGYTKDEGWFLEKVVINVENEAYEFQCRKWLSVKEGDGQTVRDLLLTSQISISQLPSTSSSRKLSSSSRLSSSEEVSLPEHKRMYENKQQNTSDSSICKTKQTKTPSRNNSFKRKTNRLSSSSFSTSSDSETEIERRQMEKQKRREKRYNTKDLPNQDKPKANVGGIINKMSQSGTRVRRSSRETSPSPVKPRKTSRENSPVLSKKGSGRDTPKTPSKKQVSRVSPVKVSPAKETPIKPKMINELNSEPINQDFEDELETAVNKDGKGEEQRHEEKEEEKKKESQTEEIEVQKIDESNNISSLTSSSSSSSSEEDENDEKKNEDLVEFSNKDTIKKYSEPAASDSSDLFMAGFLAGIKANKNKPSDEETEEEKKKREFEEKIKNGPTVHQACEYGDLERLKELISLVPELKNKADERGWCPVHISSAFGHLDLVKWLSVNGVNLIAETPTGYTAIHLAAMNGHVNCMMILSAMGCPISSRTVDHFTPLHLSAMSGHIECVKWLLSNRAKIDVKDVNDRTPLDLAEEYQHEECIQLLRVMKRELSRKDSVMAMLRDPNALRHSIVENNDVLFARGADSGVGADEEEEWVSDTEGTSDVVGRGGDDRSDAQRRASVKGRKSSAALKGGVSSIPPTPQRRLSKQDVRQASELQEKKKIYDQQQRRQLSRKTSFLDSIRAEIDDGDGLDNNF